MTLRVSRQILAGLALLLVIAVGVAPTVTLARFTSSKASAASFATATLKPPTNVAGTGGTGVSLSWTATTSTSATGYTLLRSSTSGSGYTNVKNITPRTTTTTTDNPGNGVWYYVLRSYFESWTSASSNEVRIVVGRQTTAVKGCASNAPVAGQGDGNGYELNPGNACASDGAVATDASSGTNNSISCSNGGKDKHDFWGYDFGLPGTFGSVDGITVQAIVGTTSTGATYGVCIQVSGDGGATWSSGQPVTFGGSAMTTYTFGSTTDTWGLSWNAGSLSTSSFRVRISDVGSTTSKSFLLDFIGVSVTYTP
jgi:hypothetical protein